jgi:hypothetical protein
VDSLFCRVFFGKGITCRCFNGAPTKRETINVKCACRGGSQTRLL